MDTYILRQDRPRGVDRFQAATDDEAREIARAHPFGRFGTLTKVVPGEAYPESEDGMRRAGRMPDSEVFVPM